MIDESLYQKVLQKILNFLSYAQRSENEIDRRLNIYLRKLHLSDEDKLALKAQILNRVEELNLINDLRLAQEFVSGVQNSKKAYSKTFIIKKLLKKGINKEIINSAIEDLSEDFDKKAPRFKGLPRFLFKQKMWNYLAGKGYSSSVINSIFDSRPNFN